MTQTMRNRAWSFSDCPNLSECLGSPSSQKEKSSAIKSDYRRVKTFSGDFFTGSIDNLVREAELHTAALSISPEKPKPPTIHLSPSYSRFRSHSQNDQVQNKKKSIGAVSPSYRRRIHQSPPKVVFGKPIVSASLPTECYLSSSPLANSLLIEYLALVTSENPYAGLSEEISVDGDSPEFETTPPSLPLPSRSRRRTPSDSVTETGSRNRKVDVFGASHLAPPPVLFHADPDDMRGGTSSGASTPQRHRHSRRAPMHHLDLASSPPSQRRCVSTVCCPTALQKFKPDEDVRLTKLSKQVEVDQLRIMEHDFERTHLLRNTTKKVASAPPETILQKQVSRNNSQTLFNLNGLSGLALKDPNIHKKANMGEPPALKPNATQVPIPGLGKTPKAPTLKPPTLSELKSEPISRREHNIIAPISF